MAPRSRSRSLIVSLSLSLSLVRLTALLFTWRRLVSVLRAMMWTIFCFIFRSLGYGVSGAAQVPSTRMRDSLDVSMAQLNAWKASLENLEQVMADVPKEAPKQVCGPAVFLVPRAAPDRPSRGWGCQCVYLCSAW